METKLGKDTDTVSIADQARKFDAVGFENVVIMPPVLRGFQVPSLVSICIETISKRFAEIGTLEGIEDCFINTITDKIPLDLDFPLAISSIKDENFWRKMSVLGKGWKTDSIQNHGMLWKQLYSENYIRELVENYDSESDTLDYLENCLSAAQDYVFSVEIRRLPSHLDMRVLFSHLPNLTVLSVTYGVLNLGMGYDRSLFGMKMSDANMLAPSLSTAGCLTTLHVSNSQIDDELVRVLMLGLSANSTITTLDLSHNRISNQGARMVSQLLGSESVINNLDLSDNQIHVEGGRYLGYALGFNRSLNYLNMKLNRLTDEGGRLLLENISELTGLKEINLGSNSLSTKTMSVIVKVMQMNTGIEALDLASNEFSEEDCTSFLQSIQSNHRVLYVDFRMNTVSKDAKIVRDVKDLLRQNELIRKGMTNHDFVLASK